jgi:hypothetical protein
MRHGKRAIGTAVCVALVGAATFSVAAAQATRGTAKHLGHVTGAILYSGGNPLGSPAGPQPGTVDIVGARIHRRETVRRGHRYTFALPAGPYELITMHGGCKRTVLVRANHATIANLHCEIAP